jgi:phosphoglycolate phosphatase
MLKKPDAILFDLDGTLLDTAKDLGNALNQILSRLDRPTLRYNEYRNIASDGAKGMLELGFGADLKSLDFASLRQEFLDHYQQNICQDTGYFDGIEAMLTELNNRDIAWGIVTNKPEFLTIELLKFFPLLAQCQVIISGDTLAQRKPHPLPLLHAQQQLNIVSVNTWYVGDALRDIQAANAANMTSVLAEYGYLSDIHQTSSWNADLNIAHPADLIAYL